MFAGHLDNWTLIFWWWVCDQNFRWCPVNTNHVIMFFQKLDASQITLPVKGNAVHGILEDQVRSFRGSAELRIQSFKRHRCHLLEAVWNQLKLLQLQLDFQKYI